MRAPRPAPRRGGATRCPGNTGQRRRRTRARLVSLRHPRRRASARTKSTRRCKRRSTRIKASRTARRASRRAGWRVERAHTTATRCAEKSRAEAAPASCSSASRTPRALREVAAGGARQAPREPRSVEPAVRRRFDDRDRADLRRADRRARARLSLTSRAREIRRRAGADVYSPIARVAMYGELREIRGRR